MKSKPLIGLYFGSFNPIHNGHLMIAGFMVEYTAMKEVWFVVSPQNPLKEKSSLLRDYHRLALVKIAIEGDNRLKSCDIEFKMPQPSYTIDTLTRLSEKYPSKEFALIMGSDNLESLHKWKNHKQILENYRIFVYPRPGSSGGELKDHSSVTRVDAPLLEISSSFLRTAIGEGKNISHFIPRNVLQYIEEMHFYEK